MSYHGESCTCGSVDKTIPRFVNTSPSVEKRQAEIPALINRVQESVEFLEKALEGLFGRVECVTNKNKIGADGPSPEKALQEFSTDIGERLFYINNNIRRLERRINDVRECIEL